MTREEAVERLKHLQADYNDKYIDYEGANDAYNMAIQALQTEQVSWIVGNNNAQVAVRNMPVDKLQKICAIIGDEVEPCDDAISREDALMCLTGEWTESRDELISKAIRRLKELPSAQPEQKWIPVSERFPEEDGDYFVTLENGVVKILGYSTTQRTTYPKGFYYISNGFSWRQTTNPVTAWMPLPKSYQPKEES